MLHLQRSVDVSVKNKFSFFLLTCIAKVFFFFHRVASLMRLKAPSSCGHAEREREREGERGKQQWAGDVIRAAGTGRIPG